MARRRDPGAGHKFPFSAPGLRYVRIVFLRIGIHTFTSGSLETAALRAVELGANTFQIFSASPRMWRAKPADALQIRQMRAVRERHDLFPLAIHANYLINLASVDPVIRPKSIAAFRGEVERAEAIGGEFLVVHPGSRGDRSVEEGVAAVALGISEAVAGLCPLRVAILLENTAGSGAAIGSRFEELRAIRDLAGELCDHPPGYCLDTCHLLAAGYDIASPAGLKETVREVGEILGLDQVSMFHANDSKAPRGSRVDRHAHIGRGQIGAEAFRRILTHPKLRTKPFILETPIDEAGDDRRNLDRLKDLACRRGAVNSPQRR
jgi:deoxyribonuclease-4